MSDHVLTPPERPGYPGRERVFVVRCSCGYSTRPYGFPGQAESAAREHQRAKEGRES